MQANELRIGNWVLAEVGLLSLHPHQIQPLDIDHIHRGFATVKGIPLTSGILRKSGFEERGKEWNFNVNCFEWHKDKFYYSAGEGLELSRNIRFVHELQNFYFALTGEELKIEL